MKILRLKYNHALLLKKAKLLFSLRYFPSSQAQRVSPVQRKLMMNFFASFIVVVNSPALTQLSRWLFGANR